MNPGHASDYLNEAFIFMCFQAAPAWVTSSAQSSRPQEAMQGSLSKENKNTSAERDAIQEETGKRWTDGRFGVIVD